MTTIGQILSLVDQLILTYVLGAFTNLSPTVESLWRVLFIIFIALYGYRVVFSGSFNFNDLILNTLKIVVILIIATSWGTFSVFVFDSFTEVPNEVAGRVLSGSASNVSGTATAGDLATVDQALGNYYERGINAGNAVVKNAGWSDLGLFLYALFIWVTTILLAGYALMLIVLAKLAVSILLAIGPIFILLLMFNISRGFFEGWFRALVNYAVIPVFVYAVLALALRTVEGPLAALEANPSTDTKLLAYIGPFVLLSIIGFALLTQVTTMAAGVSGGFALSTMNWAGNMARRLGGAASTVAGGGRVGREVRELGYLRATKGLQSALTNARFGSATNRARQTAGSTNQSTGGNKASATASAPSAGTPSGAAAPPRAGAPEPAPSQRSASSSTS